MNKSYRVIFNHERNAWVAVAEITPAKGKSSCKSIVSTTVHAAVISAATIGATIAPTPATADTWTATQFGVYKNSTGEIFTANNPFAIIPVKEEPNGSRVYLNSDQTVNIAPEYKDDPSGGHVDVYGGYVPYNDSETRQNAEKNTVTIGENATVGVVYGGYTSSGEALGNTVNIGKSAEIGTVRGGKGYLSASGNTVSFIGYGQAFGIIGGEIDGNSPNTNASNNTVIIKNFDPKGELLDVRGDVYGGKGNDTSGSNVDNNTVTIIGKGTTIKGNVYGGADGKSINNNTVTIADGAVIKQNVYGAYNVNQLDGGVENNTVNIEGGTVNGYVVGARISDKNKSSGHQTVNIKGGSVGSVYLLSGKSSITGEVNLLSDENSVNEDLFGVVFSISNSNSSQTNSSQTVDFISFDDRDDIKLNLGSKDKRIPMNTYEVERVGAFTEYNFYLPPNVKDKDVALETDKLLFRRKDVDVNVYIPGDAALEQNDTVYLIKTTTFKDQDPNITGNVYQGVTLQNNLGEVKIDDKDLILSMLKDNTSSTTPDPVPDPKVWNVSPNTYTTDVNETPASFNGNFNAAKDTSKAIVNVSPNDDYKGIDVYGAKDNGTTNIAGAKNLGGIIDESNTSTLNIDASKGSVQANSVKGWKEINFSNLSEKDPALALTQKADLGNKIKLSGSLNDYKKDGATFTLVESENQVNVSDKLFAQNQVVGKEFNVQSNTQYTVDEFGFHQDADKKSLYINTENTKKTFNGDFEAAKNTSGAIVNVLPNDDYKGIDVYGAKDNGTTNIAGAKNLGGIIDESNTSTLNIDASKGSVQANSVKGWKEINFSNLSKDHTALALTQKADLGNKIKLSGSLNDYNQKGLTFTLVESKDQVNVSDKLFAQNQITGKEFDILSSTQYKVDEFGFHQDVNKKSLYINTEKTVKAIQDKQFNGADSIKNAIININTTGDFNGLNINAADKDSTINYVWGRNLGVIDGKNGTLNIGTNNKATAMNQRSAVDIKNIGDLNFYLPENIKNEDTALSLSATDKTDLSKTAVTAYLSGDSQINDKDVVHLIKKTNGGEISINDSNNKVTVKQGITLTSTQEMKLSDNKQNLDLIFAKASQDNEQPQGGDEQPQGGNEQPQGGDDKPQGGNEQPQGGNEQPQGGNEQPQGGNDKPQGGNEQPQGGDDKPQGGNEQPQGGNEQPQGGNEQPQGGDDKPQGGNEQPQGGNEQPQGGNEQPQGGNEQPQGGNEQPQGGDEQPQGGDEQPQGGNEQPQGGDEQPQGGNEQPQGGDDKPQGGDDKPQGGNEQPQGGDDKPQGGNEQPQGGNEQPQGGNEQPQGGNEQPQGGDDKPQGGNDKPQGGNDKPQGGNDKPQGGNDKPQGGNDKPQGGDDKPQGGNEQSQGGNEQPQGGNEQPQGGNEQPQGGDDKPQGGDDKPQGGNDKPQGGNDKPQGGNDKPQGGNDKPQGGNEQPQGGNEQPQGGNEQPQGGDDKPQGGNKPTVNEKTKSILETPLAAMALINRSSEDLSGSLDDMYATVGINPDVNNGAAFAFGGGIKERIDSGSHIDLKGGNVKIGYAHNVKSDSGKTLAGVFAEYGRGSYDSYLDDDTHGEGTTQHLGAGVFMNHTFNNDLYLQGSVKAGKVKSDYSSKDFGQHAYGDTVSYDTDSEYVGAHIGVGKVAHLSEDDSIDVYGKYFYTQTASEDIKLSSGETYNLDKVKSHRVRVGAKYKHEFDNSLGMFVGAAFEHEFDGTVNGTYRGYDLPSPSMKGNTGILEVGLTANKGDMKLDTSIQGYTGKRRGAGLNFKLRF